MVRVVTSTAAAARLDAVRAFLATRHPAAEVVIVGASRGAADDFARAIARGAGATFGLTRFSLTELAARAAATRVEGARRVRGTDAGAEAIAARATFDARAAGELSYFAPVATMPGFPKALARTVYELRLADSRPSGPFGSGAAAIADVAALLARFEEQLGRASVDDRASLFRLAADACRDGDVRWAALPIVLLDVPLDSRAERTFVAALASRSPEVLATVPDEDLVALDALRDLGGSIDRRGDTAAPDSDLFNLRRYVFHRERPAERERAGDVTLFSAPGEGRESVEIVRRLLDEAARGVPFDEMAVFLRTPQHYVGLLEHAASRADVPMYFDRGTRRPDPSGRAFVALLSCAVDGLSAKRFDEYLSLGQVPQIGPGGSAGSGGAGGSDGDSAIDSDEEAIVAGDRKSTRLNSSHTS